MSGLHIETITIYDFQGFPEKAVPPINLGGKNLLLYGENGSGKSTIFTALAELLNQHPTREFDNNVEKASCLKHRFSKKDLTDGKIALAFTAGEPLEWPISHQRPGESDHAYYKAMSRSSGFLDYRAILRTHFLDYQNENINLFSLVVETLLRDVEMPTQTTTFGEEWEAIQRQRDKWALLLDIDANRLDDEEYFTPLDMDRIGFDPSLYGEEGEDSAEEDEEQVSIETFPTNMAEQFSKFLEIERDQLEQRIEQFAKHLRQRLSEIVTLANQFLAGFLSKFEPTLTLSFDSNAPYILADVISLGKADWKTKASLPLRAIFRGQVILNPGMLLNEARLTAIALTFYLAALKVQTPDSTPITAPRLLVLDDVLIGLDMGHRLPVLKLLTRHFPSAKGWQVMLFTYDRTWYEIAKKRLETGWIHYELFAGQIDDVELPVLIKADREKPQRQEQPVLREDWGHLDHAVDLLSAGEFKAAAVHVRTQFELVVKDACDKLGVLIKYQTDFNKAKINDFWGPLVAHDWSRQTFKVRVDTNGKISTWYEKAGQRKVIGTALENRINFSTSRVLNPLSHSGIVDTFRSEVYEAIFSVSELERTIDEAIKLRGTMSTNDQDSLQQLQGILVVLLQNRVKQLRKSDHS